MFNLKYWQSREIHQRQTTVTRTFVGSQKLNILSLQIRTVTFTVFALNFLVNNTALLHATPYYLEDECHFVEATRYINLHVS
jgi:hypothetical protein